MKEPPDKGPTHKTVKISLKSIARNDIVIEKLTEVAVTSNKIMLHTLQLMKMYLLDRHAKNLSFPTINRSLVTSFMKVLCKAPKNGRKPSESTKIAKDEITVFYESHYKHLQRDELSYTHLNTVLDYLADTVVVMYENNISQRFLTHVERFVNVVWKKRELIRIIQKNTGTRDQQQHRLRKLSNNLRRVKHDLLNPDHSKTSPSLYHEWIDDVRTMILPDRDLEKESVFYDLVCHPQDYLRGMVSMMKQVESSGCSVMCCFPLRREVKPKYVPIDTTTLVHVLLTKEAGKKGDILTKGNLMANQARLWSIFFKTDKQLFHADAKFDYQFTHMIETDGVGCSVLLVRKDLIGRRNKSNPKSGNTERYIDQLDSYDELRKKNIVAIDPNKSDLIYCIDSSEKTFRYTADQRRKETKTKKYRDLILQRKQDKLDGKTVIEWETELSDYNSRTLDLEKFQNYCRLKNEINQKLGSFYSERLFRKLKLGSFFMRQQTEENMLNRFEKIFGSPNHTLIGFGDFEQKSHMKFKEPVKGKGFRNLLRKRGYDVYLVDEFRTSCRCSACEGECKVFRKCPNPRPWRNETILRHGLLKCQLCSRLWNRDHNASRNIHKICVTAVSGEDRPDYLKRSRGPISDATSAPSEEREEVI